MKKFLVLSLLIGAHVMAMDRGCGVDPDLQEEFERAEQEEKRLKEGTYYSTELLSGEQLKEKLSNKEEETSLDEIVGRKWNDLINKSGIKERWQVYKQKFNEAKGVKITKATLSKVISFAKEHEIPTSIAMSIFGYMVGNYMPVRLVDGVGSSCVTFNIPFITSTGICVPFVADFISNNVKFFSGLACGILTKWNLGQEKKQKSE